MSQKLSCENGSIGKQKPK